MNFLSLAVLVFKTCAQYACLASLGGFGIERDGTFFLDARNGTLSSSDLSYLLNLTDALTLTVQSQWEQLPGPILDGYSKNEFLITTNRRVYEFYSWNGDSGNEMLLGDIETNLALQKYLDKLVYKYGG